MSVQKKALSLIAGAAACAAFTAGALDHNAGVGKVTICHKGKVTISVGIPALPAHLFLHGDSFGPCGGGGGEE